MAGICIENREKGERSMAYKCKGRVCKGKKRGGVVIRTTKMAKKYFLTNLLLA